MLVAQSVENEVAQILHKFTCPTQCALELRRLYEAQKDAARRDEVAWEITKRLSFAAAIARVRQNNGGAL